MNAHMIYRSDNRNLSHLVGVEANTTSTGDTGSGDGGSANQNGDGNTIILACCTCCCGGGDKRSPHDPTRL
jgi:hypothetical protein